MTEYFPNVVNRRYSQKIWMNAQWSTSFNDEGLSMNSADVTPDFALGKIMTFFENGQTQECILFIHRVNCLTLRAVLSKLPIRFLVGSLPRSIGILEALYTKFYHASPNGSFPTRMLHFHDFLHRMTITLGKYSSNESQKAIFTENYVKLYQRALSIVCLVNPHTIKGLTNQKMVLDHCAKHLGDHGLVSTSTGGLLSLQEGIVDELQHTIQRGIDTEQAINARQKSRGSRASSVSAIPSTPPVEASHYRLLQMKVSDVHERLARNLDLSSMVEPFVRDQSLRKLFRSLKKRISCDRRALHQFRVIQKCRLYDDNEATSLYTVLRNSSMGCGIALDLLNTPAPDYNSITDEEGEESKSDDDDVDDVGSDAHATDDINVMTAPSLSPCSNNNVISSDILDDVFVENKHSSDVTGSVLSTSSYRPGRLNSASQIGRKRIKVINKRRRPSSIYIRTNASSTTSSTNYDQMNGNVTEIANSNSNSISPSDVRSRQHNASLSTTESSPALSTSGAGSSIVSEMAELQREAENLKQELERSRETIKRLHERERQLRNRLSEQARKQFQLNNKRFEDIQLGDARPGALIQRYGALYSDLRMVTLDTLDNIEEFGEMGDLKEKLLFSVVVLAFRSAQQSMEELRGRLRHVLHLPFRDVRVAEGDPGDSASKEMEASIGLYLTRSTERFDLTSNVEDVLTQLFATLFEYPCLKQCDPLRSYVHECVHVAWGLSVQRPPYIIQYDATTFRADHHTRFHTSDLGSVDVKDHVWPALFEGTGGPCVQKGIVIT